MSEEEDMNTGKAGEGRPEPSPQNSGTGELSEEEIEKKIRIAQMEERLRKELERIQRCIQRHRTQRRN